MKSVFKRDVLAQRAKSAHSWRNTHTVQLCVHKRVSYPKPHTPHWPQWPSLPTGAGLHRSSVKTCSPSHGQNPPEQSRSLETPTARGPSVVTPLAQGVSISINLHICHFEVCCLWCLQHFNSAYADWTKIWQAVHCITPPTIDNDSFKYTGMDNIKLLPQIAFGSQNTKQSLQDCKIHRKKGMKKIYNTHS